MAEEVQLCRNHELKIKKAKSAPPLPESSAAYMQNSESRCTDAARSYYSTARARGTIAVSLSIRMRMEKKRIDFIAPLQTRFEGENFRMNFFFFLRNDDGRKTWEKHKMGGAGE